MIKIPRVPHGLSAEIVQQVARTNVDESLLSYVKSIGQSSHVDLLKTFAGPTVADGLKELLAKQTVEPDALQIRPPIELISSNREQLRREQEMLELTRRHVEASEAALAEARQQAIDAVREKKRAYATAVVGLLVGLAGVVVSAWPYIAERL